MEAALQNFAGVITNYVLCHHEVSAKGGRVAAGFCSAERPSLYEVLPPAVAQVLQRQLLEES